MTAMHDWLVLQAEWLAQWPFDHRALTLYFFALLMLFIHFWIKRRDAMLTFFISIVVVLVGMIFFVLWHTPEPIPFSEMVAVLVVYGLGLFIILSDVMLMWLAGFLTRKRGEKWVKELDYVYLTIGAVGILMSMNRIEFLTNRFEGADILAPLVLTTAVVIRVLKTRADIGGWNKPNS
jgi:hypothetical protein